MIFALQTSFLNPSPQLKLTINDSVNRQTVRRSQCSIDERCDLYLIPVPNPLMKSTLIPAHLNCIWNLVFPKFKFNLSKFEGYLDKLMENAIAVSPLLSADDLSFENLNFNSFRFRRICGDAFTNKE